MSSVVNRTFEKLEKWFFWFWVKRYKVSFLAIFLIVIAGLFSLFTIPKESSPDIKFGIISVTTPYIWVNPNDIDSLITEKIEKELDDITGIKKITSRSSVWMSSITIELDNDANTRDVLTDIKDSVDKVDLPEDAEDSNVIEISSSNELMYEVLLYWKIEETTHFELMAMAQEIKNNLEWKSWIASIDLGWADMKWFGWSSNASDYEIKVLLDKEKIELLWLSLREISWIIKSYNKNTPIWNYSIWDLNYDFRFDWELENIEALKNVVIRGSNGSHIYLKDISKISREYKNNDIKNLGFFEKSGYNYVSLVFNKAEWANVFSVSEKSKKHLEEYLSKNSKYDKVQTIYIKDMSELIIEDYSNLADTATQTLILVFITILIFVWLRESIIASLLIPLAFLITFIVLDTFWYSLNFLTNFSLVLTLWIAIDTVIVIIEWASEKIKLWYNRKSAILLAVKDYKAPLIAWTLTTLVAFLPLMFLPWVMWKFLAYIPITVFSTLVAALFLSLTVSSALFITLVKNGKTFHRDEKLEATFSPKQVEFLEHEREWKTEALGESVTKRDKVLWKMWLTYYGILKNIVTSRKKRLIVIIAPIILLILTFAFISPKLGFTLFPASDQWILTGTIETKAWSEKEVLEKHVPLVNKVISNIPETKVYYVTLNGNMIDIYLELENKTIRENKGQRTVFEVEKEVAKELKILESEWLTVSFETLKDGPPTGKPIWVKLIANSSQQVDALKETAEIFKEELKTFKWVKNASTTSSESPGQFIFKFNRNKLAEVWLTPDDILSEVYFYTNGLKAWSIKSTYEDNDIVLKIEQFDENLSPEDINDLIVKTKIWDIRVWDFANYQFTKAVSSINRQDWKITITVESNFEVWVLPSDIQPKLIEFAKNYNYPEWISYSAGWENEENMDLIVSTMKSLLIALFLIFSILVFQFNSYGQPAVVLYSVILALLWVNIWLWVTWNPYSMPFMIWFIALTWVVVNDAIILIDRINKNLDKWIDNLHAVLSAWKSRLQPIIVTTLTTVFGVLPLAMQDEFWAWLWYTIVFWLFAGSAMTLIVIPSLYYEIFLREKKSKKVQL